MNTVDNVRKAKFSTYAYYYVLGEITKYIRENKAIKVSKDVVKLKRQIESAKEVMTQRLKREPSNTELSLFLEIDEEKLEQVLQINTETKSLDFCYENEKNDLYNSIITNDQNTKESILDLKNELLKLSSEERGLIIDRYFEEMTQLEASKKHGLSQAQVSRQETKILKKLRKRLEA